MRPPEIKTDLVRLSTHLLKVLEQTNDLEHRRRLEKAISLVELLDSEKKLVSKADIDDFWSMVVFSVNGDWYKHLTQILLGYSTTNVSHETRIILNDFMIEDVPFIKQGKETDIKSLEMDLYELHSCVIDMAHENGNHLESTFLNISRHAIEKVRNLHTIYGTLLGARARAIARKAINDVDVLLKETASSTNISNDVRSWLKDLITVLKQYCDDTVKSETRGLLDNLIQRSGHDQRTNPGASQGIH